MISAVPRALYVRWQLGDRQGFARWASADGSTRWRVRTAGSDSFATTREILYRTTPTALQAWSTSDGSLLWSRTSYQHDNLGQPVFADGVVWAMDTHNDFLSSFDASNGDFIRDFYTAPADWSDFAGYPISDYPVLADVLARDYHRVDVVEGVVIYARNA